MKFASTNNSYTLVGRSAEVHNSLPTAIYRIEYDQMSGYSLTKVSDSIHIGEKVYGSNPTKVHKVLKSFDLFNRSLGVILSGEKGSGKSLFTKQLAKECLCKNMPVIQVNKSTPNLTNFIQDLIDQPMMIIFDEFEKIFDVEEEGQVDLLTLFDGSLLSSKALFVITCNDVEHLDDCLINRPGRFHYHIRFASPTAEDITEYMRDNIPVEKYDQIDKLIQFSENVPLNYDCLRSIAFELTNGETLTTALNDLNIIKESGDHYYDVSLVFNNGTIVQGFSTYMDITEDVVNTIHIYSHGNSYWILDIIMDIKYLTKNSGILPSSIKAEDLNLQWFQQDSDSDSEYKYWRELKNIGLQRMLIKRKPINKQLHYVL